MAVETGRWPLDLLDVPVWQLLYVFHHLNERDERRQVMERAARVDAGFYTAIAVNDPSRLDDERRAVGDAIDALEFEAPATDPAVLDAKARALIARIESGRVLSPDALQPIPSPVH